MAIPVRRQIITEQKLQQWIESKLNVLFVGKHGTGKTSMIVSAWNNAGLRWKYFSGATLDPWVDFIGIPQKVTDVNGNNYIELIRPKEFANDEVEAIFCDEYNRCLTGDTKISLVNGKEVAIKDLVGIKYFYVYAYNHKTDKIVVAKGHSARKTIKNAKLVEVTLDNDEKIRCTSDHPFLTKEGKYVNAIDLKKGQSLMPLYRKMSENQKISLNDYEMVKQTSGEWEFTHRLADKYNLENGIYTEFKGSVRHHSDFDKLNNSPENIEKISWSKHKRLHKNTGSNGGKIAHIKHPDLYYRTIGNPAAKEKALSASLATRKNDPAYKILRSKLSKKYMMSGGKKVQAQNCKASWEKGQFDDINQKLAHKKRNMTITIRWAIENLPNDFGKKEYVDMYKSNYKRSLLSFDRLSEFFGSFSNFKKSILIEKSKTNNHKVVSVKVLNEREDVYDITVDKHHNFSLSSGVFVHNSHKKVRNAIMELIQFKSINGKVFKNLRFVWAAVNPEDDDTNVYDVEKIDPAQEDRFQIHVTVPYEPNRAFFTKKYGADVASQSIVWWKAQTKDIQNKISPRRLEYTLDHFNRNGSLEDVLPEGANIPHLVSLLSNTPLINKLKSILNNKDIKAAREFIADEENYDHTISTITGIRKMLEFFVPVMPQEKISKLISDNVLVRQFALQNGCNIPEIRTVIESIVKANVNKDLCNQFGKVLSSSSQSLVDDAIATGVFDPNAKFYKSSKTGNVISSIVQVIKNSSKDTTFERKAHYEQLKENIPDVMGTEDACGILEILEEIASRSHEATLDKDYVDIVPMVNTCVYNIHTNMSIKGCLKDFTTKYPKLTRYLSGKKGFLFLSSYEAGLLKKDKSTTTIVGTIKNNEELDKQIVNTNV
jgi:intein/homing endonuclease